MRCLIDTLIQSSLGKGLRAEDISILIKKQYRITLDKSAVLERIKLLKSKYGSRQLETNLY